MYVCDAAKQLRLVSQLHITQSDSERSKQEVERDTQDHERNIQDKFRQGAIFKSLLTSVLVLMTTCSV